MRSAIEIVIIWGGALLLGLALRALLPSWPGVHFTWKQWSFVIMRPPNRVAFWICLIAGLSIGSVLLVDAMLRDLGFR